MPGFGFKQPHGLLTRRSPAQGLLHLGISPLILGFFLIRVPYCFGDLKRDPDLGN